LESHLHALLEQLRDIRQENRPGAIGALLARLQEARQELAEAVIESEREIEGSRMLLVEIENEVARIDAEEAA